MNISVNDKWIYLGAGCGLGLVIGLLFAPQSGHEIRHTLTSKIDDLTNKVQGRCNNPVSAKPPARLGAMLSREAGMSPTSAERE